VREIPTLRMLYIKLRFLGRQDRDQFFLGVFSVAAQLDVTVESE
jgi:hypothetical protein